MCAEMRAWARDQHSEGRSLGDAVTRISARISGCDMLEIWVGAWVEMRSIRGERRRRGEGHERAMLLDPFLSALLTLVSLCCCRRWMSCLCASTCAHRPRPGLVNMAAVECGKPGSEDARERWERKVRLRCASSSLTESIGDGYGTCACAGFGEARLLIQVRTADGGRRALQMAEGRSEAKGRRD